MNTPDDALIGPNPRDVIIQEITRIKEQQVISERKRKVEWQKFLFKYTTENLAKKYFKLHSLDFFDSKKLEALQDLIYEKAKRANIRHKIILALIPMIGWSLLALQYYDDDFAFSTHKFVKFYKKFRKKEESRKADG